MKILIYILLGLVPLSPVWAPSNYTEPTEVSLDPQTISDRGIDLIKKYEGLRLKSYRCPAGYKTIGYGHQTRSLTTITVAQAERLLREDLAPIEAAVNALDATLTQSQFDAVCSFAFNVGLSKFQQSTFAKTLDPQELKKWVYADNRKLTGLIQRRNEEIELFTAGGDSWLADITWGVDWPRCGTPWRGHYC